MALSQGTSEVYMSPQMKHRLYAPHNPAGDEGNNAAEASVPRESFTLSATGAAAEDQPAGAAFALPSKPVSSVTIACYSLGHFLNDACASCWFSYLLLYLENVQGLSGLQSGVVLFSGQLFDALATPAVGMLSDRSAGFPALGLGRRKLWNAIGVAIVIVCFFFVFGVCLPCVLDGSTSSLAKTASFAVFASLFNVGWAAVQVSHMALVPELTVREEERVLLNSMRYGATILANVFVFVVMWLILRFKADDGTGNENSSETYTLLTYAVLGLGGLCSAVFLFGTPEPLRASSPSGGAAYVPLTHEDDVTGGDSIVVVGGGAAAAMPAGGRASRPPSLSSANLGLNGHGDARFSIALPTGTDTLVDGRAEGRGGDSVAGLDASASAHATRPPPSSRAAAAAVPSDESSSFSRGGGGSLALPTGDFASGGEVAAAASPAALSLSPPLSPESSHARSLRATSHRVGTTRRRGGAANGAAAAPPASLFGGRGGAPPGAPLASSSASSSPSAASSVAPLPDTGRPPQLQLRQTSASYNQQQNQQQQPSPSPTLSFVWEAGRRQHMTWRDWLRLPSFWKTAAVYMFTRLAVNVAQVYLSFYVVVSLELTQTAIAVVPLINYIGSLIATTTMKRVSSTLGRFWALMLGGLMFNVGSVTMFFLHEGATAPIVYPAVAFLGVGSAIAMVISVSMEADLVGTNTESGAFVYGAMSLTDKLSNGVVIIIVQVLADALASDDRPDFIRAVVSLVPAVAMSMALFVSSMMVFPETLQGSASFREWKSSVKLASASGKWIGKLPGAGALSRAASDGSSDGIGEGASTDGKGSLGAPLLRAEEET